jgi:hypothetical protein
MGAAQAEAGSTGLSPSRALDRRDSGSSTLAPASKDPAQAARSKKTIKVVIGVVVVIAIVLLLVFFILLPALRNSKAKRDAKAKAQVSAKGGGRRLGSKRKGRRPKSGVAFEGVGVTYPDVTHNPQSSKAFQSSHMTPNSDSLPFGSKVPIEDDDDMFDDEPESVHQPPMFGPEHDEDDMSPEAIMDHLPPGTPGIVAEVLSDANSPTIVDMMKMPGTIAIPLPPE